MATLIYILIGLAWGAYSVMRQRALDNTSWKVVLSGLVNCLVWPIGMMFAIVRGELN